jgi:hypothetical protein
MPEFGVAFKVGGDEFHLNFEAKDQDTLTKALERRVDSAKNNPPGGTFSYKDSYGNSTVCYLDLVHRFTIGPPDKPIPGFPVFVL